MINFEYIRTSSVKAAVDALAKNPTGGFIAGGTNLIDLIYSKLIIFFSLHFLLPE